MPNDVASLVEQVARRLCEDAGYDPEDLEPGNVIIHPTDDLAKWRSTEGVHLDRLADDGTRPPDGVNRKGDKCHFMWRQFIARAQVASAVFAEALIASEAGRLAAEQELHELQVALTGLTRGGSEYFSRRPDGSFKADIKACVDDVRRRQADAGERTIRAIRERKAAEAALAEVREALETVLPFAMHTGLAVINNVTRAAAVSQALYAVRQPTAQEGEE